ncbi:MAG: EAL domain-containing protein [Burkholderiaceae bacterium]|nr:EAL domain-containing protein [Burkholderiaceae bacterium]
MRFPVLNQYLSRLSRDGATQTSIQLDAHGRAQGRFFNCTMTSAFQPVRELQHGAAVAYEGLARSAAGGGEGLSLWKLLDSAASDDESVELDRLCRMLHAINFFRQEDAAGAANTDLYLNVHSRLLSAVSSNHGYAFRRILDALELPLARIVLLLPPVTAQQGWLINYVADNYRRNGFRFAVQAAGVQDGAALLERVRPDVLRLDARAVGGAIEADAATVALLEQARCAGVRAEFHRLDSVAALQSLHRIAEAAGTALLAQGSLLDVPQPVLAPPVLGGEVSARGVAP